MGQMGSYHYAVLDPPLPGCLCSLSSPAGALCAPGDPCRALCPCRDPCRALCSSRGSCCALLWWRTYRICWTCLDWWLCQQSWPGSSLQELRIGRGAEAVQSLEIDWPAKQSPENGLAYMFKVPIKHAHLFLQFHLQ